MTFKRNSTIDQQNNESYITSEQRTPINRNKQLTISANDDELYEIDPNTNNFEDIDPKIRILRDNKSIFSELTDKATAGMYTMNAQPNRPNGQFVNEDFQFINDHGIYKGQNNNNETTSLMLLAKVPLMQRPSLYQTQQRVRPQTQNKQRAKKSNQNDQLSMNFSLFHTNAGSRAREDTFSNDQTLVDYFQQVRQFHTQSEQKQRTRIKNNTSNIVYPPTIQNEFFNNKNLTDNLVTATLSTMPSQIYKRAQSSQGGRLYPLQNQQMNSTMENTSLNYTLGQDQESTIGTNMFDIKTDYMDNNFRTRPLTASSIVRKRKIRKTVQRQVQKEDIQQQQQQQQIQGLNFQKAFSILKEKQLIDTSDKKDLYLLDKIQSRYQQTNEQPLEIDQNLQMKIDSPMNSKKKSNSNSRYNITYKTNQSIQEEISQRVSKRFNSNQVFRTNKKGNDDMIYEDLKEIMEKEEEKEDTYMKLYELKKIQDKLKNIQFDFFKKKLGPNSTLLQKSRKQNDIYSNVLNTTNKMEPMSKGPYLKSTKEIIKKLQEKEAQEQLNGYNHAGSPFDHPYFTWMDGLRKQHQTQKNSEIEIIKKTKEEVEYSKYLAEVKALNLVKDFLSENRNSMSSELKSQLINKILKTQNKLRKFERIK